MARIKITEDVQHELDVALRNVYLMHARIGIVLYSYGLNECRKSFTYIKQLMIYLYHREGLTKEIINRAIFRVATMNDIVLHQMRVKLNQGLKYISRDILDPENKYKKMSLERKIRILAENVFEDILFELKPGYLLPIIYKLY